MATVDTAAGVRARIVSPQRIIGRSDVLPTNCYFVVADAAGPLYVDLAGIMKPGVHNLGMQIQPHGCDVVPGLTLGSAKETGWDPVNVPWMTLPVVADEDIRKFDVFPLVLRLDFSAPGRCYISAF
jgi:hypothetical protein